MPRAQRNKLNQLNPQHPVFDYDKEARVEAILNNLSSPASKNDISHEPANIPGQPTIEEIRKAIELAKTRKVT